MSYNSFDYYSHLREYQLHVQKLENPQKKVPTHEAFKPIKPNIQRVKQYERNKRIQAIERENQHIMNKLVKINRRKSDIAKSLSALSLPKIKKQSAIPLFEEENNIITIYIIQRKSSIKTFDILKKYQSVESQNQRTTMQMVLQQIERSISLNQCCLRKCESVKFQETVNDVLFSYMRYLD